MARTSTFTRTFARLRLLQINVKGALAEIGWSQDVIDRLVDHGLDDKNQWITTFHSYGVNPETTMWEIHFWIKVRWDIYGQLAVQYPTVGIDDRWRDNVNPGLVQAARGFAEILRDEELLLDTRFTYANYVYNDPGRFAEAQRVLGAPPPRESPKPTGAIETGNIDIVGSLAELSSAIEFAVRDDG